MPELTIGKVAREAGVNIETLRYYERRGIIPKPLRTASNYRIYFADTVRRVRFVKRAQALGFSLQQIRELLALRADGTLSCDEVRRRATRKIEEISEKIRVLEHMRKVLEGLVATCSEEGRGPQCPILDALDSDADTGKGRDRGD